MKRDLVAVLNIIVDGIVMEAFVLPVSCDTRTQFQNIYLTDGIIHRVTKSEYSDKAFTVVRKEFVEALTSLNLEALVKLFKYREIENALGLKEVVVSGVKVPVFNVKLADNSVDLSLMDSIEVDCKPIVAESMKLSGATMSGVVVPMHPLQDIFDCENIDIKSVARVYDILEAYAVDRVHMFNIPCTEVQDITVLHKIEEGVHIISLHNVMVKFAPIYTFRQDDKKERITLRQLTTLGRTTVTLEISRGEEIVILAFATEKKFSGQLS